MTQAANDVETPSNTHERGRGAAFWRVLRYLVAGSGSLALDLLLQWGFVSLAALPVWLGSSASYEIGLLAHFVVVNRWVFRERRNSWRRLVEFHAAALTAEAITLIVTNALVYGPTQPHFASGLGPTLAKIAGTGLAFVWTFSSSFFWIWRPRPTAAVAPDLPSPSVSSPA